MEEPPSPTATTQVEVIAQRVNHLFDQFKAANGHKATDQQVADRIRQETGTACSRHWVRNLRNAKIRAPDLARLQAIASFFGVSHSYLFDDRDAAEVDDIHTARRVNLLFAHFTDADGLHATDQQVADHIAQVTRIPCPPQWVHDLRDAKTRALDLVRLEAIASFFGVSRRYLFNDTVTAADEDIETALTIKKLKTNGIHLRELGGFSNEKLRVVAALIRSLAKEIPDNGAT